MLRTCNQDGFITHSLHQHMLSLWELIIPAVPRRDSRNQGYKSNNAWCRDAGAPESRCAGQGQGSSSAGGAFSSRMHVWEHIQSCREVLATTATKPVKSTYHLSSLRSIPTTATGTLPSQMASRLPVLQVYLHAEDNEQGRADAGVTPALTNLWVIISAVQVYRCQVQTPCPLWQHFHMASQNVQGHNFCPYSVSSERLSK